MDDGFAAVLRVAARFDVPAGGTLARTAARFARPYRLSVAAILAGLVCGASAQPHEVYGQPDAPLAALVLGTEIRTSDPEEMRYVILRELTDRYASENDIRVQQEEIEDYVASMERIAEQDRKEREARRAEISGNLASESLTSAERESLSSELATLNELDSMLGRSGEKSAEDQAAQREIGAAFVRQWKINQALFRQYGGRVIFQQGGPEPLDAYRRFLEDAEKRNAFRILDPSLEPGFWRYYRTDSIHSFYPAGSDEEASAFETPWWLMKNQDGAR